MKKSDTVAMISGESSVPMKTITEMSSRSQPDRNTATSSLLAICLYFFATVGGVLISHFRQLPAALILSWVGLGAILLLKISQVSTKFDTLTVGCMFALVPLSYFASRPIVTEFALVNIALQAIILIWKIRSFPRTETMGETMFYGSLNSLCAYFRILAMLLIFESISSWSSRRTSFYLALASCLFFASASWLGSNIRSGSGCEGKMQSTFSCSSGTKERPNFWIHALLVVVLHAPTAFSLFSFATRGVFEESDDEAISFLLDSVLFCFASALYLQVILLAPNRLFVQSNATIAVQTFGHTYEYEKAVQVHEVPAGEPMEGTDSCHVYCERGMRTIVVELADGKSLFLTPQYSDEFMKAVMSVVVKDDLEQQESKNRKAWATPL